jgi:uncharacterized repeat protein (TIGR03803 family)
MRGNENSFQIIAALAITVITFFAAPAGSYGQTEKTLYSFNGSVNYGASGVILGPGGGLYGIEADNFQSLIYGLDPANGGWTFSVLSSNNALDFPSGPPPLVADASGNLYGSSYYGGAGGSNAGMVYELSPALDGSWNLETLYAFSTEKKDGQNPTGPLTLNSAGNLYGTTLQGGGGGCVGAGEEIGCGTVFELVRGEGGIWTEKILHAFNVKEEDGVGPNWGVVFDNAGNLYGTTLVGGLSGDYGTVFELSPVDGGSWKERILHRFNNNGKDGYYPEGVVLDANGKVYGTTASGGAFGTSSGDFGGTVYALTATPEGGWNEEILRNCGKPLSDNGGCVGILALDASGNLYGIAAGGVYRTGTVYELSPSTGGNWTQKIVYSFNNENGQPYDPWPGVVLDAAGNIYGIAGGGANGQGAVYEIIP